MAISILQNKAIIATFFNCRQKKKLVYFFKHHGISKPAPYDSNVRDDVHSGELYGKLRTEGKIDDLTITLQANADGANHCDD